MIPVPYFQNLVGFWMVAKFGDVMGQRSGSCWRAWPD